MNRLHGLGCAITIDHFQPGRVRVALSEAGAVRVTARLWGGRALGAVDVAFAVAGKRSVRVPLAAAGRRALNGRRRARIVVRLTGRDVHGNRTTRKLRRTLRWA